MRFFRLIITSIIIYTISIFQPLSSQNNCIHISSILVDACGNPEGENEMVRLRTGNNPILVSNISFNWPNNGFLGFCKTAQSDAKVAQLNSNNSGCGIIISLGNTDTIPANSNVLVITSVNFDIAANPFNIINDTLYLLLQCAGNTFGHFANYNTSPGLRTTTVTVAGAGGCNDVLTYDRTQLVNVNGTTGGSTAQRDGARANKDFSGVVSYSNQGCSAPVDTLKITMPTASFSVCNGDSISLNASVNLGITSSLWSGGNGSFSQNNQLNTVYNSSVNDSTNFYLYLTVTDICGVNHSDSILVTSGAQSVQLSAATNQSCGDNVAISANVPGGTWQVINQVGAINNSGVFNPSGLNNGIYQIVYQLNNPCADKDTFEIEVLPSISANINPVGTLCSLDSAVQLSATPLNGNWTSNRAGAVTNNGLFLAANVGGGVYQVVYSLPGACFINDTIDIQVSNFNQISLSGPSDFCTADASHNFNDNGYSGVFSMLPATSALNVNGVFNPAQAAPGNYQLFIAPDSSLCQASDSISISVAPTVKALIQGPTRICLNDSSAAFNVNIAGQWTAFPALSVDNSGKIDLPNASTGNYSIVFIASDNCAINDTLPIEIKQLPEIAISSNITGNIVCPGQELVLSAISTEDSVRWNTGESSLKIAPTTSGTYTASASNECGMVSDSGNFIFSKLLAKFSLNSSEGQAPFVPQIQNESKFANTYNWLSGDGQTATSFIPSFTYNEEGSFALTLSATDSLGCSDTMEYLYLEITPENLFFIPNVFTPNGDGFNDVFEVKGNNIEKTYAEIYNRWGQMIYSWEDKAGFWDGKHYSGQASPEGVYSYIIKVFYLDKKTAIKAGSFTLLR